MEGRQLHNAAAATCSGQRILRLATNGGTQAYQKPAPTREKADKLVDERLAAPFSADANDFALSMGRSRDYDPSPGLERIRPHVLAINAADDERNPPETGHHGTRAEARQKRPPAIDPGQRGDRGHGTTGMAKFWKQQLQQFMQGTARHRPA